MIKKLACGEIFIQLRIIPHNLVLIYGTRMCFAKFWPFYLIHQHIWLASGICTMKDVITIVVFKLLYYIHMYWLIKYVYTKDEQRIYTDILLFDLDLLDLLNKIPFLLYEQLFIYTTIWFKRNILLGSILSLSYYLLW